MKTRLVFLTIALGVISLVAQADTSSKSDQVECRGCLLSPGEALFFSDKIKPVLAKKKINLADDAVMFSQDNQPKRVSNTELTTITRINVVVVTRYGKMYTGKADSDTEPFDMSIDDFVSLATEAVSNAYETKTASNTTAKAPVAAAAINK